MGSNHLFESLVSNFFRACVGEVSGTTLKDITKPINDAYKAYMESNKIESTHIWIQYASNGAFANDSKGTRLFPYQSKFKLDGFSDTPDGIQFDFGVFIKVKHSTGTESFYNGIRGRGCVNHNEKHLNDPDTWYKNDITFNVKGAIIPYSKQAYETLEKARDGLRGISEILFNFINQDASLIESTLLGGNLLETTSDKNATTRNK